MKITFDPKTKYLQLTASNPGESSQLQELSEKFCDTRVEFDLTPNSPGFLGKLSVTLVETTPVCGVGVVVPPMTLPPAEPLGKPVVEKITKERWNDYAKETNLPGESRNPFISGVSGFSDAVGDTMEVVGSRVWAGKNCELNSDWLYIHHMDLGYFLVKFPKYHNPTSKVLHNKGTFKVDTRPRLDVEFEVGHIHEYMLRIMPNRGSEYADIPLDVTSAIEDALKLRNNFRFSVADRGSRIEIWCGAMEGIHGTQLTAIKHDVHKELHDILVPVVAKLGYKLNWLPD